MPKPFAGRKLSSILLLACAAHMVLIAGWAGWADAAEWDYVGKSLSQTLLHLQSRGLKIVFTSNVVRPEMTVIAKPLETRPRRILNELLKPHGLEARDGPRRTIVIVRQAGASLAGRPSILGFVRSRRDATPLPDATIRILELEAEARSDADGRFVFSDPGSGPFTLEAQARRFLTQRMEQVAVPPGESVEITFLLDPALVIEEELVVTPSRVTLLRQEPLAPLGLSREEILALPHLGDDFFRALTLLPGATANDASAEFHLRGGHRDETQILIDGQELYEAYHLKDYDNAVSFVAATTLDTAELNTGGFSAQYGDRMSGVLDMTTVRPTGKPRFRIGASFLSAHAGGAGTFAGERGSWLAEARRGSIDLVARLLGDEDPQYWDAFAKFDYQLGTRNSLRVNLLHSDDQLDFQKVVDEETKRLETEYDSSYFWLTHQAAVGDRLFVETAVSRSSINRDRRGVELEEDAQFNIRDERDAEVFGLRQGWSLQLTPEQTLRWGWELRDFDTEYDYFANRSFDNPLAQIRHDGGDGTTIFAGGFREEHNSLYVADRWRPFESLTLELGARFDSHSQTQEDRVSPRLNLAYAIGDRSVLRLAWGRFNQSQRPYELQVEDGETTFHPVERSEHRVVSFEKLFERAATKPAVSLRIEVYQREVKNPRPRYENLYEPFNIFPEVEPERIRIAPQRALAEGIEIFVRGGFGQKTNWWANYAYASTDDRIDGIWRPRLFDQTHALNLDWNYRASPHWSFNLAWRYHTGWPTTPLSLQAVEDEEGEVEFVPLLGSPNSERLSTHHRLDLRASRRWRLPSLAVDLFLDVQNVYNRKNHAGFDFEIDDEQGTILATEERWTGIIPSLGVGFEF